MKRRREERDHAAMLTLGGSAAMLSLGGSAAMLTLGGSGKRTAMLTLTLLTAVTLLGRASGEGTSTAPDIGTVETPGQGPSTTVPGKLTTPVIEKSSTPVSGTFTTVPETTTQDPETTTQDPETTTLVPETTTAVPETTTSVLETITSVLEPNTTVPDTTTAVAVPTTSVHETTTAVPEPNTTVPETTTPVPETSTSVPETTTPVTTTPVPETTTPVPETTTQVPETTTPVPETTTTVPETTTSAPETTTAVPGTSPPPGPADSCPLVGDLAQDFQKCLDPLRIQGTSLLTSNPFSALDPDIIYDTCNRLTEADIERSIACALRTRDMCVYDNVTEEVRMIDMTGVENAIKYICRNKDIVNDGPSIICLGLQRANLNTCIRDESAKSFAALASMGKDQDKIARRCTKLRIQSYCHETVLMAPCGYRFSVFKRTIMDHMIPQTCNCRKEVYNREEDPEDCYDESDCLEHIRPGMVETDLYKGVVLGMQTVDDIKHFCDYHNNSIVESRVAKGIRCIEEANHQCTYKSMRFKHMHVDAQDLIEASHLICDRIHTFTQFQECFERGQRSFKDCVANQWMIENPGLRAKGLSDNLEEYLQSECRINSRCVEHTFRVCSVMLLDVLEEVNHLTSPVLCKECEIKGASIIVADSADKTFLSKTWTILLVLAPIVVLR